MNAKRQETFGDEALEFDLVKYEVGDDGEYVLDDNGDKIEIERETMRALPPTAAQVAVVAAGLGRHTPTMEKIATAIDFFYEVMDENSAAYVRRRLLDRYDPFGIDEVSAITRWMFEEWSGNPTNGSSGSSQSPPTNGRSSKRNTSKSTSSTSQPVGS